MKGKMKTFCYRFGITIFLAFLAYDIDIHAQEYEHVYVNGKKHPYQYKVILPNRESYIAECPSDRPYFNCTDNTCSDRPCLCMASGYETTFNTSISGSYMYFEFSGGQRVELTMRNSNILGCAGSMECHTTAKTVAYTLLPWGTAQFSFDIFTEVPVGWRFTISTISDVATIHLDFVWIE